MELLLRVRWRHVAPADLRLDVEAHHTVDDLVTAANAFCEAHWDLSQPAYLERSGRQLDLAALLADSGIVSGDTIRFELYGVDTVDRESLREAVSCDVTAGPEAGRSFVLLPGRHMVGRALAADVVLDDPTVSEDQLYVLVHDDLVTAVAPNPAATNPLFVNGRVVTRRTRVGPDDVVQFGATAVALRVFSRTSDTERDQLGQVPFRRTPYRPVVVTERHFAPIGGAPTKPEARKFSMMMVMLPLMMGFGMFAFTKSPLYLMMTAMSPISAIGNWRENRRTGADKFVTQVDTYAERLDRRKQEVADALLAERSERINQSPDLADLARRATLRTLDLWARQRSDGDFLRARLGLGAVASKVKVDAETSGEEHIRVATADTLAGFDRLAAVPICVELAQVGVFGLHGDDTNVRRMCASVLLQAVTLHSPEDLVVVIIEGRPGGLGAWAKWLPHTRSVTSPIGAPHIVEDPAGAGDILRELLSVARMRTAESNDRADHRWPWVLVVLDESADADPALTSQLLELCPRAGISVVAAVSTEARVPRQAVATMGCLPMMEGQLSTLWFTDPEVPGEQFEPEPANARLIDQVAMSLAPLRDATAASATTAIPRIVPLLSLFGAQLPTPESVAATWAEPKPYGLRAPIGIGPAGPLELDLVEHGPHALIGGTSGAGKSELLQSIVASLVSQYPPTRLNFLFVDYKGGASSTVFNVVPHTVGYVTNLEASLSLRALTSLRAELNHRMRIMEGKAKDLPEMLERHPDEAPPSLVIVVDEFATLVKEVPDFVAGIVDIAQRGRSLGIHLILATQRPSGSVNDNILANTNLRISLRMLDGIESQSVIGVKSAADIPLPLKGRGFAKLGPRDLIEFQSAFTGAALTNDDAIVPVTVHPFGSMPRRRSTVSGPPAVRATTTYEPAPKTLLPPIETLMPDPTGLPVADLPPVPVTPPIESTTAPAMVSPERLSGVTSMSKVTPATHLDLLLAAVTDAMPGLPAPRKPWREMLPELLLLDDVERPESTLAAGRAGRFVIVGMLDDPAAQAQYPCVFDLEEGGGLLLAGGGGSGKTTALRSVAVAAVKGHTPAEVTLFVVDCASRSLQALRELPHCAAVATGDDLESISRVIARLNDEIDRRRRLLSELDVQAESLSAYLDKGHEMSRVVVLVDGYQNLSSILGNLQAQAIGPLDWMAAFHRIVTDGRQVGVHVVMAVDRRQAVPALLMSSIASRLVLRQTDEQSYSDYGIPMSMSKGMDLPPGRGLWNLQLVQVGVISDDATAAGQARAIAALADSQGDGRAELASGPPPEIVRVPLVGSPRCATVGRRDVSGDIVEVDVTHTGLFVVGPPRSGRSTALRRVAWSLAASGYEVWSIGLVDPPAGGGHHCSAKTEPAAELLNDLAALCESLPPERPYVLVVDNLDRFEDPSVMDPFERMVKTEAVRLIGAIESRNLSGYTQNIMLSEIRREPNVLMLEPDAASDVFQTTGVRAQLRPGYPMTAGRGVLVSNRAAHLIQVAVVDTDTA